MEGDYEGEEKCECAGCEKSAVHVCNGCGIASYCSELHMLEDWKNHAVECAYTINDVAGASHWAVEMEVGQDQEEWVPTDQVHAAIGADGSVASTITNAELVSGLASFSSTDLQLGGVGSGVPRGKITRSNDLVSFRVVVTGLGYRKVADFDYKITAASASRGVPRGRGMAFVLPEGILKGLSRDVTTSTILSQFDETGAVYIQVGYRGRFWSIYGAFTIAPSARLVSRFRTPSNFRLKARDADGFMAVLMLNRSASFKSAAPGDKKYTLREIQVYIPEGNSGVPANMIRFPSGITEPGRIEHDASGTKMEPIDAEVLEDVVALIDVLQDEKDEMTHVFIGAQQQPSAATSKEIQAELSELTRVINVLEGHAETLRLEEIGEKAPVNIAPQVFEAIRLAEEFIAANAFTRGFSRARKNASDRRAVAREAKNIPNMDNQELLDYFKQAVQDAESARTEGREGTPDLMRARNALRAVKARPAIARLPAVAELSARFATLERTQHTARSIKKATVKREHHRAKKEAREAGQKPAKDIVFTAN